MTRTLVLVSCRSGELLSGGQGVTGPALTVLGYTLALAIPAAILVWPLLERAGRIRRMAAITIAVVFWGALSLPPTLGLVLDRFGVRQRCEPGEECADYILWWFAIPVGWLLGAIIVFVAVTLGRRRH